MGKLNAGLGRFKAGLAGLAAPLAAALSLGTVIRNTVEAQDALAQLDVAYRNAGESAKRSKREIVDFAEATQRSTTFSDEAVVRAQTNLLRFSRVSGEVFSRARSTILDVAAALGTDLETASFTVGRALESPTRGLRELRTLGIIFTDEQQRLIGRLQETGRVAEAQAIILQRLEDRYSGAAKAARNTLGGAIEALKNALGDLFESTNDGANKATEGLNAITDVISGPELKNSVQSFVGESLKWLAAFTNLIAKSVEGWQFLLGFVVKETPSAIDKLYEKQSNLGASLNRALEARERARRGGDKVAESVAQRTIDRAQAALKEVQSQLGSIEQSGKPFETGKDVARRGGGSGLTFVPQSQLDQEAADRRAALLAQLENFNPRATKIELEGIAKLMREFEEATRTAGETASFEFEAMKIKLQELNVSAEVFKKRVDEVLDAQFGTDIERDLEILEIRLRKLPEPLTVAQQRVKNFTDAIKQGLQNAADRGKFSFKDLGKFIIAQLVNRQIYDAIDKLGAALNRALSGKGSSGGGGFFGFLGGLFGFGRAGGGRAMPGDIVGEDGPEIATAPMQVFNRRQLAFMGAGGGGVTFSTEINITGGGGDRREREELAALFETRMQQNNRKQLERVHEMMKRNDRGSLR